MALAEIKDAVLAGQTVCWSNDAYTVIHDSVGQWFVQCSFNGSCFGLTWRDGVTMNGRPEQFYIA